MVKYLKSAQMSCTGKTSGGLFYLFPELIIKAFTLTALIFLWKTAIFYGADAGMSLSQMLSYTYISSLLSDMLTVKTEATGWMSEGVIFRLYGRPVPVVAQLAAQTIGSWIPNLVLFSVPMAIASPLIGVNIFPVSALFFLSLLLCISLGFAIDLLFACLSMKLKNTWIIDRIRTAMTAVLSGTIVPINLLPSAVARIVKYQPFASLGGAPLLIFVGSGDTQEILFLQIFWNIILWVAALLVFKKSREGMVSYG